MLTPAIVLIARGDNGSTVQTSLDIVIGHLRRLRPDLQVGLGFLNSTTPTVHEAVEALADTRVEEMAAVPMDPVLATDHSPVLTHARDGVGTANPGPSIVIAHPVGLDIDLLNALDIKLHGAPHRANAVEVGALVLACPDGGGLRGSSLFARRARRWSAYHELPIQLAQNDITGRATALTVNALRGQGRRHIAVGSLFLTPGPAFWVHQQAAIRAGALAVTPPIAEDPRVTELILARYAFAAMWLPDIDPHENGIWQAAPLSTCPTRNDESG